MKSTNGVCCTPMRAHEPWVRKSSKLTWPNAYLRRKVRLPARLLPVPLSRVMSGEMPCDSVLKVSLPGGPALVLPEPLDAAADLVADLAHSRDRLSLRILEGPVLHLGPGDIGTLFAASHGDEMTGSRRQLRGQELR